MSDHLLVQLGVDKKSLKMKFIVLIISVVTLLGCSSNLVNSESQKLEQTIDDYQVFYQTSNPLNNPTINGNNAKLPDLSPENLALQYQREKQIYDRLQTIDQSKLTKQQQINLSVLQYRIKNELDNYTNKEHFMPLTAESGFHVWISRFKQKMSFKTKQDYQNYLTRLQALPKYFAQQMSWMKKGIEAEITQPKVVLQGYEASIAAFVKKDASKSVYFQPFIKMPDSIALADQEKLKAQAKQIILSDVNTSYQQYYDFMVNEYKPNARQNIAATSLPNGQNYYQNRVDHYTTLTMSADEIHQVGLQEVKRIRQEMEAIIKKLEFEGNFADFINFLRTDEQFYAKTPTELLKEAAYISKKMDAQLPRLFKTLPRTPYGVKAVPANIAPKYTTGRYSGPSRDDQPGYYWVNTYRLDRRPLYVLEALTLHEAVPGHHLQGAIAKEMNDVPEFRNKTYISAFGEGWGLYSEYLGIEAGFYQNPYSDFGRLTYEMWRACRLVVDTGMHSKGWSRQQAMDYLASNTALSLHNVKTEIDRYISWPGQALSYKIGELTIKRLRQKAQQALADKFDLREFHDQLLKNGSMPLSMLEQVIEEYIETTNSMGK